MPSRPTASVRHPAALIASEASALRRDGLTEERLRVENISSVGGTLALLTFRTLLSGRVLRSGEHLVPEAALEALADQNIPFTVKGKATYEQQVAALRGATSYPFGEPRIELSPQVCDTPRRGGSGDADETSGMGGARGAVAAQRVDGEGVRTVSRDQPRDPHVLGVSIGSRAARAVWYESPVRASVGLCRAHGREWQ